VRVAKHGNRSITSKCGSADVMEALGVTSPRPPGSQPCLDEVGLTFFFAPAMHSAMKACPDRSAASCISARFFNLLGPLTNPARATCQVVGVYSAI